jgi:putative transposase
VTLVQEVRGEFCRPAATPCSIISDAPSIRTVLCLQYGPRVIVTGKLRSYGVAQRQLLPGVEHRQSRYLNNGPRPHIDRRADENGRCNGSNRLGKPRTSSPLTPSFTVISIPAAASDYRKTRSHVFNVWGQETCARSAV